MMGHLSWAQIAVVIEKLERQAKKINSKRELLRKQLEGLNARARVVEEGIRKARAKLERREMASHTTDNRGRKAKYPGYCYACARQWFNRAPGKAHDPKLCKKTLRALERGLLQ